jgi:hypothetical protein
MAFARKLQKNAALFQRGGAYHRNDKDRKISLAGLAVINQGATVRLYAGRAVAVLYIWILLRIYAWPLLGGDSPIDGRFWVSRFLPAYQTLEDKILELTRLVEPQNYQQLLVKTSRWRKTE